MASLHLCRFWKTAKLAGCKSVTRSTRRLVALTGLSVVVAGVSDDSTAATTAECKHVLNAAYTAV